MLTSCPGNRERYSVAMPLRIGTAVRWSVLAASVVVALYFAYGFLLNVWRTALPLRGVSPEVYIGRGWILLGLSLASVLVGVGVFFWLRRRE